MRGRKGLIGVVIKGEKVRGAPLDFGEFGWSWGDEGYRSEVT